MPPRHFQGGGESCVVQGVADLVYAAHQRQGGSRADLLSVMHLWWFSRLERGHRQNVGTTTRTALRVARRRGFIRAAKLPYRWQDFNVRPPDRLGLQAIRQRGLTYERIAEKGAGRVEAIKLSIASGFPVAIGYNATADPRLAKLGGMGHLMVAYEYDATGVIHRNWWRELPDVRLPPSTVARGRDPWRCTSAPSFAMPTPRTTFHAMPTCER